MPLKKVTHEQAEAANKQVGARIPFWTVPSGSTGGWKTSYVRVLPTRDDHPDDNFGFWAALHRNLPGNRYPVLCARLLKDEYCAACDTASGLWEQAGKDENLRKLARVFTPSWVFLCNVVVVNQDGTPAEDSGVMVWAVTKTTMLDHIKPKAKLLPPDSRAFWDLANGHILIVRRKGKGQEDTKYEVNFVPQASEADEAVVELVDDGDGLYQLDKVYSFVSDDRMQKMLTAPTARAMLTSPDPFDDDDDEDDDDDDVVDGAFTELDDEDEEEEELPTPPRRTAAKKPTMSEKQAAAKARLEAKMAAIEDDEEDED